MYCVSYDVSVQESSYPVIRAGGWKLDLFSSSLAPCADFHCESATEGSY